MHELTAMISLKNRLLRIISEVQSKHKANNRSLDGIDLELGDFLKEVNWHLMSRCRKEINLAELKKIERQALGHHDYSNKFALYCAQRIIYGKTGI